LPQEATKQRTPYGTQPFGARGKETQ
jgi:hypothetical protein